MTERSLGRHRSRRLGRAREGHRRRPLRRRAAPVAGTAYAWPVPGHGRQGTVDRASTSTRRWRGPAVLAVLWHGNAPRLERASTTATCSCCRPTGVALPRAVRRAGRRRRRLEAGPRRPLHRSRCTYDDVGHDVVLSADHPACTPPSRSTRRSPPTPTMGDADAALAAAEVVVDADLHDAAAAQQPDGAARDDRLGRRRDLTLVDSTPGHRPASATALAAAVRPDHGRRCGSRRARRRRLRLQGQRAAQRGARRDGGARHRPAGEAGAAPGRRCSDVSATARPTIQRVRLGADASGRLTAIDHEAYEQTSHGDGVRRADDGRRPGTCTPRRTSRTSHRLAALDVPTPALDARAGRVPGDVRAGVGDGRAGRRPRHRPGRAARPQRARGRPRTSARRSAAAIWCDCLREGAERFGWAGRDPRPAVRREGRWLVGTGVAVGHLSRDGLGRRTARVRRRADGALRRRVNATDIGTGARTVLTQIAADALGVDPSLVELQHRRQRAARGAGRRRFRGHRVLGLGGRRACTASARRSASTAGCRPTGCPRRRRHRRGARSAGGPRARTRSAPTSPRSRSTSTPARSACRGCSGCSPPGASSTRARPARQFLGGMTMGLGWRCTRSGVLDPRSATSPTHDLAEYHVPATRTCRRSRRTGWTSRTATSTRWAARASARSASSGRRPRSANAVHHATGVRVRDLPIHVEDLLPHLP